jgi:hypothetical protein
VSSGAADELLHAVVIWAQRRVRGSGEWLIRSVDVPVQVDVYEGTPDSPERGRWWKIIERNGVTISYIPPTAIRSFMKQGEEISKRHDMSFAADTGVGGRADQSRGLRLVPPGHRRRPHTGRGHVVADRDRRDHDQPAARHRR